MPTRAGIGDVYRSSRRSAFSFGQEYPCPMGISTAASHFHQQLAEVVLAGLLYFICELYMDDILVHGNSEKEFVKRLETVFQRLRQFNITLTPVKCVLGIHQVEFVGHVVDENGISMSSEKIERLVNFPKPMTGRKLRSFLGLANYFRDHIRGLSMLMAPLNRALDHKKRESVISWALEMDMAFEQIKTAIAECPKLVNMRSDLPIFLHTDASDHGIGAYLFQVETTERG
jgi:cleavage and polyadenylation specificity factor subunit 1